MKHSLITLGYASFGFNHVSKHHHYENKIKVVVNWPLNVHGAQSAILIGISPLQTFCPPV